MWPLFAHASRTATDGRAKHGLVAVVAHLIASSMSRQLGAGLMVLGFGICPALASDTLTTPVREGAQFAHEIASADARYVANWALYSGNHGGLPFIILDKKAAKVFVFNGDGKLRGAAPALIGFAVGDDSVPGIGDKKLSAILPEERTTPAGRFVASLDRNLKGGQILWVDYDAAISMHPVITSNAKERRAERLASPSPLDNRISYGCINVLCLCAKPHKAVAALLLVQAGNMCRAEKKFDGSGFRQHIDDAVAAGESRGHDILEEIDRHVDAAIRNAVIQWAG